MSDIVITEGDKPLENSTEETVAVDSAAEIAAQATNTAVKTLEVAKEIAAETSKNDLIAAMIDQRLSEMRTAFDVALSEMNSRLGQISDALTALAISEAEEVEEVEEVEEGPWGAELHGSVYKVGDEDSFVGAKFDNRATAEFIAKELNELERLRLKEGAQ